MSLFILTPCYILKYDVNELRFYLLEYEQLKMNIEEHSISVQVLPTNAEILVNGGLMSEKMVVLISGTPTIRNSIRYMKG